MEPVHLIIVDDEADVRTLLANYFARQGCRVTAVASGRELLERMAVDPADIVLLDLGLPAEDGFVIARRLREHWRCGLIIVSGRGDTVDRVVGLEVGADDYVTKPFDLRELLARVKSLLRRLEPMAGAGSSGHPDAGPAVSGAPAVGGAAVGGQGVGGHGTGSQEITGRGIGGPGSGRQGVGGPESGRSRSGPDGDNADGFGRFGTGAASKPGHGAGSVAGIDARPGGGMPPQPGRIGAPERFRFDGWTLDAAARRLIAADGAEVELTGGEFDLLQVFVRHPGRVLSRDFLLEQTRGRSAAPFDRTIDVQIGRLRRKLGDPAARPKLLKAVRGAGYLFIAEVAIADADPAR